MNAQEIKDLRKSLGLTREQFSVKLGVSMQTVANWERGIYSPTTKTQPKLERLRKKAERLETNQ